MGVINVKKWIQRVGFLALSFLLLGSLGSLTHKASAASGWKVTFYSHSNLTGAKATKTYSSLNMNWGTRAPAKGIPSSNYSATIQKSVYEYYGLYDFHVTSTQAFKLYVDGKLAINQTTKPKSTSFHKSLKLTKGYHNIEIKYYKSTGTASVKLSISQQLEMSSSEWFGKFYPTKTFSGTPKYVGSGYTSKLTAVHFNWGKNAPASGIPKDNFSAEFQRKVSVTSGKYDLKVQADDQVMIYVDGKLMLNKTCTTKTSSWTQAITLTKGTHTLLVKYVEKTSTAKLSVDLVKVKTPAPTSSPKPAPTPTPAPTVTIPLTDTEWNVGYFPSSNLTGTPVLAKLSTLNVNWGTSIPASGIPADHFSAQIQKKVSFDGTPTDLEVWAEDGVQIYLDGKLVIDQSKNTTSGFWHVVETPSKGEHTVMIKYFENTGSASLRFETGSPYRTLDLKKPSNITASTISAFLTLNNSPLVNDASAFIAAQTKYGVNATYLVAHAILESGWGKSVFAQYKNNLYGYQAYDECPYTCALSFPTQVDSINYVSYSVLKNYLSPTGGYYLPIYGPNLIGMNTYYASGSSWYSSIASLMNEIQPYSTVMSYYNSQSEKAVTASSPGTYTSNSSTTYDQVNFPSGTKAVLTADPVNFRTIPYVSSSTLIRSLAGKPQVTLLGYNTDVAYNSTGNYKYHWYRAKVGTQTGWLYGGNLTIQNLFQISASTGVIQSTTATSGKALSTLLKNQYLNAVLDSSGKTIISNNYYEVVDPGTGKKGWISVKSVAKINQ